MKRPGCPEFRLLFLFLILWLPLRTLGADPKLNLFIWSEYIPPGVVKEFEQQFQCKLVVDVFEEAEAMLAKLQGGGSSTYDVVVVPDYLVAAVVNLRLAAPLRHEKIPNLANLDPRFRNPPYDSDNRYTAAYQWGTVGIYVRKQPGREIDPSWSVFFDPARRPGSFVMIDSMRDLIGAALKYRGYSFNSTDPRQLKEARDLILAAKKHSAGFVSSVGGKNKVLEKSAQAAIVYSGEGGRGMAEDKETTYFLPREGTQMWVDNLMIMSRAPNRDLAEKFINFVLSPETGAKISNFTRFSTPNDAAKKLVEPELLRNEVLYPDAATMNKLELLKDLGTQTRLYDELWTHIKSR